MKMSRPFLFLISFVSIVASSVSDLFRGQGGEGLNPKFVALIKEIEQTLDVEKLSIFKDIKEFFLDQPYTGLELFDEPYFMKSSKEIIDYILPGKPAGSLFNPFNLTVFEIIRDNLKDPKNYKKHVTPYVILVTLIKSVSSRLAFQVACDPYIDNTPQSIGKFMDICNRFVKHATLSKTLNENKEVDEEEGDLKSKTKKDEKSEEKPTDDKESEGGPAGNGTPSWLDRNVKILIGVLVVFVGLSAVGLVFFLRRSKR